MVPSLLLVEVAGAISRTRQDAEQAQAFATALSQLPNVTFLSLDEILAGQASALAAQHQLRGADAVYAAVALRAGCTLISLDREHLTRLKRVVTVRTPAELLPDLVPP
jgi:predicted nucleic acid-binding protein